MAQGSVYRGAWQPISYRGAWQRTPVGVSARLALPVWELLSAGKTLHLAGKVGKAGEVGKAGKVWNVPNYMEVAAGNAPDAEPGSATDFFADGSKTQIIVVEVEDYPMWIRLGSGDPIEVDPDVGLGGFIRAFSGTSFTVWNVTNGETAVYQIIALQ